MVEDPSEVDLAELLAEVRRIEAQSSRLVSGVMAGGYSSVFRGAGLEFDNLREYVEGDDPRSVDWNVTARVGRPFIKEYVEERELSLLFVLDLSASMDGGFGNWSARQTAARVCACLALSAVRNDDRVGLVAFSGAVDKFVPARKGVRHVLRIVRDCLALRGASDRTALGPAIEFAARAIRRHAVIFVVSDFLGDGWQPAIRLAARRHDVIAVRLNLPEDEALDGLGMTRLRDPETGRTTVVDWRDVASREAYRARVTSWRERATAELRRAGVDTMEVPVPREARKDAISRPILQFFRMREQRGMKR